MLPRSGIHALKALLELALDPPAWRSVRELAEAQALPAPMLEQVLLQLRRAGLVEARRGRSGGYRLARPAAEVPLAAVLAALSGGIRRPEPAGQDAGDRVTAALGRRLERALERELERFTLEELLYDLHSTRAALSEEGGLLLG
ncbi:MAG: Rrf2 family transcriptional regulator [Synechococcaceae cyanobacterium]|nr:Rrf2 family transcriptional regulator [Synechococcaceae cyanobacterium]